MTEQENKTKDLKFYSQRSIGLATFLGGPLAAGYLIRENYRSLNQPEEGLKALIIGIITSLVLFGGLGMLPEHIVDKIPSQIIPIIYTSIIYVIVDKIHGDILKAHKENNNEFFSGWRAAGIGIIGLIITLAGIFGYIYFYTDQEIYDKYDQEMALFSKNEAETLFFYDHLETHSRNTLIDEIDLIAIPKWEENIETIHLTDSLENLPPELAEQNKLLFEYSELRIKAFKLFRKAIEEETNRYDQELDSIHDEINIVLEKLN